MGDSAFEKRRDVEHKLNQNVPLLQLYQGLRRIF